MEASAVDADFIFRLFTKGRDEARALILDTRQQKHFKKLHVNQAFCVRMSSDGKALVDHSKSAYKTRWSQGVWWGKNILVYGDADLKKSHPAISFLLKEGQCKSLVYYREGFDAFLQQYPFLCTQSVKANSIKKYPSQITPGLLYLGDWEDATHTDRLIELNIKRVITIHNHPEKIKLPKAQFKHIKFELPDVEASDISEFFNPSFEFIEEAREDGSAILVHCGAGMSRSAALCAAYLMRKMLWSASRACKWCKDRRAVVEINQGFQRTLVALEAQLGINARLDPKIASSRAEGQGQKINEEAAGGKVAVQFIPTSGARATKQRKAQDMHQGKDFREDDKKKQGVTKRVRSEVYKVDTDDVVHEERMPEESETKRSRMCGHKDAMDVDSPSVVIRSDSLSNRSAEKQSDGVAGTGRSERTKAASGHSAGKEGQRRHSLFSSLDGEEAQAQRADEKQAKEQKGKEGKRDQSEEGLVVVDILKNRKKIGTFQIRDMITNRRCVFGRAPDSDVLLEHASISRQHAQLEMDTFGTLTITDLGSGHGTNVDGVWIRPRTARQVKAGSVLRFGASTRSYQVISLGRSRTSKPPKSEWDGL